MTVERMALMVFIDIPIWNNGPNEIFTQDSEKHCGHAELSSDGKYNERLEYFHFMQPHTYPSPPVRGKYSHFYTIVCI